VIKEEQQESLYHETHCHQAVARAAKKTNSPRLVAAKRSRVSLDGAAFRQRHDAGTELGF